MASGYQAGSAYSIYALDLSQFDRDVARVKREIAGLQAEAAKARAPVNVPRSGGGGGGDPAKTQAAAERAILSRAAAEARLIQTQNTGVNAARGLAAAERTYEEALSRVDRTSVAAIRAQTQLTAVRNRAAQQQSGGLGPALPRTVESFGGQALGQLKSGLLGIVGPAALATAAIGGVIAVGNSFKEAFNFKADLDATTASIKSQLTGFRDVNATYADAIAFGARYKITQQETNNILSSSTDILRTSKAGVGQLEEALIRLQSRDVSKPISEASRALRELASGDVTSIKELFNIPAKDALKMRDEIRNGGDAVLVLTSYLNDAKIGMDALKLRAEGTAGALNDAKVAQEELKLAQAQLATSGGGVAVVQAQTEATKLFANTLGFNNHALDEASSKIFQWLNAMTGTQPVIHALATESLVFTDIESIRAQRAVEGGVVISGALQTELSDKIAAEQQTAALAQTQAQLDADSKAAAQGLFASGDQALALANKYGIATDAARFLIQQQNALAAKSALAEQRAGERSPGTSGAAEVAAQEERRLQALYLTLQDPPDKPRTGRGGGGLSDQQNLNNSLLADQAKANDRFEDAQIKHEQAILKIEKDFAAKSLDAQKKNESNKRRSRFDFYKSLSKDTATIGKAAADDLSAQYEAAFAESQRLAQAGNQVQAREFLALRKEQIAADQEYYRDRAEAQKEAKDGESKESRKAAEAEIGRLDALRALEKDAQAEDLKQLLEGGDQLQADKAAALQNENAQYEQAQSKIELASDRATDHKIANALRAGKAIEAENALLVKQGQIYQSLPGGAGATNGALPTATDTPAAAGAAAAALMAVVDTALLGAVQAQTSMQVEKFDAMIGRLDAVERAVRSVRGSGGVAG